MNPPRIKNRQPEPPVRVVRGRFAEFEDLQASARHWDLDFRQLSPGRFHGEIDLVMTADVHVGRLQLARRIEQTGAPPPGLRTLAVSADPAVRLFWRGRPVDGQEVLIYPRGAEIDAISWPGFEMYVLSFSEEVLHRASEAAGIPDMGRLLDTSDSVRVDPHRLQDVRRHLATWFRRRVLPRQPMGLEWVHEDLPVSLLRLLAGAPATLPSPPQPRMDQAIQRVQEHLRARPCDAPTVKDLSRLADVSERTLRHGFRNRLGVSPKAYLRDRRLNLVRQALRRAERSTTKIADIANRWSFWHMGQFAADYRRLFGELPSETLSRRPPR